jgi:hypothetical protein
MKALIFACRLSRTFTESKQFHSLRPDTYRSRISARAGAVRGVSGTLSVPTATFSYIMSAGIPESQYRSLVRQALVDWRPQFLTAFQTWNLETVRTLALVNSAGLAGVSAIYASDSAAKIYLGSYPSAAFFALGLVVALLNMYANSQGHLRREREVFSRIVEFDNGKLDLQAALRPAVAGKYCFWTAEIAGWSALVFFCAGGWPFIHPALARLT